MLTNRPVSVPAGLLIVLLLTISSALAEESRKPLKVFILAGQSNMQGHAHVRTLEAMGMDPEAAPLLRDLCAEDGTPRVCEDVWISSLSSGGVKQGRLTAGFGASGEKIGPELSFGVTMRKRLGEPIVIIKTAWGGKSLNTDFRSPSAGPYELNDTQLKELERQGKDVEEIRAEKAKATGRSYRLMIEHVKKVLADLSRVVPDHNPEHGHELAGFVWFQGWNDMVDRGTYPRRNEPGGYDAYAEAMAHFIRDVRRELSAPKLPFVIGVMGVGGPVSEYGPGQQRYAAVHQSFRDAMAASASNPELSGVTAVLTERCWDGELTRLRARDAKIRQPLEKRRKRGEITRQQEKAELERQRAKTFGPRERRLLDKGVSNAEYHYLGSAKILSRIGEAFAEALLEREGRR